MITSSSNNLNPSQPTDHNLNPTLKALEVSERETKALFEQSNDGIIIVRGGKFANCNQRISDMFGYPKEQFLKNTPLELSPEYQPSGKKSLDGIGAKIQAAMAGQVQEFYWKHKKSNGELFDTDVVVSRFDIEEEIYLQIIVRDTTELRLTKDTLSKKVQELERYIASNKELEQFAHATAHDLKEPLRTVKGFAQLLHKKEAGNLQEASKEYMDYIIKGIENMDRLIHDLLDYSSASAPTDQAFKSVDLPGLLNTLVKHSLHQQITENNANIQFENLPSQVKAVPPKLSQLFQNLLSNAIKFRSENQPCEVLVQTKEMDEMYLFEVIDNGIGMEEKNLDKVFEVFTRLNSKSEYEGSGIGLATCKKIIQQHGGRIWATSQPGQGTTFSFTLPK